jgi:hypothetical protein
VLLFGECVESLCTVTFCRVCAVYVHSECAV